MDDEHRDNPCDVTIAILTRDGGPVLARALEAVVAQETSRRLEIVAIDSGSTDDTVKTLLCFRARIVDVFPEEFDFGKTRDLLYAEARGEFVVNLSQDAVPAHPRWLENLLRPFEDERVGVSCGRSVPDPDRDLPQFPWERNGYFYFTREYRKFVARYGRGVSFANSAVRRALWERLRIDPQPLGEDFQFQKKLKDTDFETAFPDDAEVLHHHNYDLRALYDRCHDEGAAVRIMGCPYNELDLLRDLASPSKYIQWLRELKRGSLRSGAALTFPVLRPIAVYAGSRFGQRAHARDERKAA